MLLKDVLSNFKKEYVSSAWRRSQKQATTLIRFINGLVENYAKYFNMSKNEVITIFEQYRNYSFPNYYQSCQFIKIKKYNKVFETTQEAKEYNKRCFSKQLFLETGNPLYIPKKN